MQIIKMLPLSSVIFFLLLNSFLVAQNEVTRSEGQYFRGYLLSPEGDSSCNPCVEHVIESINKLRNRGETMGFNWGDNYPEVMGAASSNHWQGIQRMPVMGLNVPYLVVASSHRSQEITPDGAIMNISHPAHFAVVELASRGNDGGSLRSNRLEFGKLTRKVRPGPLDKIVKANMITPEFDHPGGLQAIGKYLLASADHGISHSRGIVLFTLWDMSTPRSPQNVWRKPRWELSGKAPGSVGIVRLENGGYLVLRALKDAKRLEFYILNQPLEQSPATYHDGLPWDTWDYNELQSTKDRQGDSLAPTWADLGSFWGRAGYQNTNIVRECGTGTLYLIASHGRRPSGFGGSDYLDAYRLDVPVQRPEPSIDGDGVYITKVAKRRLFLEHNSGERQGDLQAAAGIYVSPDNQLYLYATEHGVSGEGGFVKMIEFGPAVPKNHVNAINEAWAELYSKKDFDGRSIILDYIDRHLRDYAHFKKIEAFNNLTSSAIYAIPVGYTLRLYRDTNRQGGYFDLVGTGKVERISDFDKIVYDTGEGSDDTISSAQWIFSANQTAETTDPMQPHSFELQQNYPNPFNSHTVIDYHVPKEADIKIEVFDIRGQLIRTLVQGRKAVGFHSVKWGGEDNLGNNVANGTYLYRVAMGKFVKVRTLTIVR